MGNSTIGNKSSFGESKILAGIQAKRKLYESSRMSNSLSRTQGKIENDDKPRVSGKDLLIETLSPVHADNKPLFSSKHRKNDSNFFVTNEMINLGYLNTSTNRDSVRESYAKNRYKTYDSSLLTMFPIGTNLR